VNRDAFVEDVLHGGDRSAGATLLRGLLTPPAWLHQAGLEAYLLPYRTGIRKRYRLPVPVVAIGNLTSGGTGKTPMTAFVAGHLRDEGRRVVVLSRGHGGSRETSRAPRIVSDWGRALLTPQEAGDEPVLLANLLPGVPVIVGRDRRRSGRLAIERFAPEVIILDDALQYWQLHRDLDIVLLDARHPFDNGYVLPRGLLREPPAHLSRAGIAVLTRADRVTAGELDAAIERVRRSASRAAVFTALHAPLGWFRLSDGALLPTDALCGERLFAFSGIADHSAFRETVDRLGGVLQGEVAFGDHHAYSPASIGELAQRMRDRPSAVVTTEKDMVKVAPLWPADAPPLYALRIGMQIDHPKHFFERIDAALASA
jgi:tetraacyldisaccharide 4'-kinase